MAFNDYSSPKPDSWVTVGGVTREGVKNPSSLEGYYMGTISEPSSFDKNKLKHTHLIQTAKGIAGVNGSSNLNFKMKDSENNLLKRGISPIGVKLRIEFVGTKPSSKGNPTKLYKVTFDVSDINEAIASGVVTAPVEEYASNEEDESYTSAEVDTADDEDDALQTAALAAAERKAKVEALLAKGKNRTAKN